MEAGEALLGMTLFLSIAATIVLRGPLGRALADRIAGRRPEESDRQSTALLERALGELEDVRQRLAELEERQDFAERVLVKERQRHRLQGSE